MAQPKPSKANALGKLTAVRFDPAVIERLQQIGAKDQMDRDVSWLIRHAVDKFIASYKPAKK